VCVCVCVVGGRVVCMYDVLLINLIHSLSKECVQYKDCIADSLLLKNVLVSVHEMI